MLPIIIFAGNAPSHATPGKYANPNTQKAVAGVIELRPAMVNGAIISGSSAPVRPSGNGVDATGGGGLLAEGRHFPLPAQFGWRHGAAVEQFGLFDDAALAIDDAIVDI